MFKSFDAKIMLGPKRYFKENTSTFHVLTAFSSVSERINDLLNRKVAKGTNETLNFKRLLSDIENFMS